MTANISAALQTVKIIEKINYNQSYIRRVFLHTFEFVIAHD